MRSDYRVPKCARECGRNNSMQESRPNNNYVDSGTTSLQMVATLRRYDHMVPISSSRDS